ncbi:calcium-activated chloride channel regulator 1-like [Discoglossus pictus]
MSDYYTSHVEGLLVFYTAKGSMIKLNNGGYEDIVIAINPSVSENISIINNIQNMTNEASAFLFNATKQRLFIRSVKIIIPLTWTRNNNYKKLQTETYDKADVIIANPFLKYGDEPYTLQYRDCGEPGRYIHFTPNFMLDDGLNRVYGPRGRVFVHEWAHLRWGVFDEYNNDKPYYITKNGTIEATRCSLDITGTNRIQRCTGGSCVTDSCNIDISTNVYENGCTFIPYRNQIAEQSIMYSQSIDSITDFCDANNHNFEAPTLQNQKCNLQSTWDVIMKSTDIESTTPRDNTNIPVPSYSLLQYKDRVVTLVIDVSTSMTGHERLGRLYQAADVFLIQIIEKDSYVGIVKFSNSASTISSPVKITNEDSRKNLKSLLPKTEEEIQGTNICIGLQAGIVENSLIDGSAYGTEIILLTDGEDNNDTSFCYSDIKASGAIIHVISVGPVEAEAVKGIAGMTGGILYLATDKLDANDLIDTFSGLFAHDGEISKQAIQLESTSLYTKATNCLNGTVFIDSSVGNDTFFLVTWQQSVPTINLEDPSGQIYNSAHFISDTTSRSTRLSIPGTAETGPWHYSLCNAHTFHQVIGLSVTSRAADEKVPPIRVNVHVNKDVNQYPSPMVVYAIVNQGHLSVKGATVTATVEPVTGISVTLQLLDNGAGADVVKNDGIYSRYFMNFTINGRYSLKVRVESKEDKTLLGLRRSRALYIPGYVEDDDIFMNPPRPVVNGDDFELNLEPFSRTASGGSFIVYDVPFNPPPDIYKPAKITDLEAKTEGNNIVLSWTATGDDLDKGNGM